MTPAEAKALSVPEYLAFALFMDRDMKAQRKAQRARTKR